MNKLIQIGIFVTFDVLMSIQVFAGSDLVRFPGSADLRSPDRRFVLSSLDIESGGDSSHFLVVRELKTDKEKIRIHYRRYVEVLWSPDGQRLLMNDHGGSDYSDCKIISLLETQTQINVSEPLKEEIEKPGLIHNHHFFIEGVKWLGNDKLLVKAHGYGDNDPNGFIQHFIYDVSKGLFTSHDLDSRDQ